MRHVIALTAAALAFVGAAAHAAEEKELLLFNWSNYMSPDLLKRFEAETGKDACRAGVPWVRDEKGSRSLVELLKSQCFFGLGHSDRVIGFVV